MQRENMLEQEEHEEKKREGCTCCGPMICSYVTSVLVMCHAAWVINQLQGSEGSLYSIQNNMFSVLFENSEPCFTSGAKLTQVVSRPYACFRCSYMIANPPVPSSGTHSTQCNKKKEFCHISRNCCGVMCLFILCQMLIEVKTEACFI